MNKVLARFYWDCGRMGDVEGLFITTKPELEKLYDKYVYFGEILGKHSEVDGNVSKDDLEIVSEEQDKIEWLGSLFGTTVSGYNPFEYLQDDEEEEDEDPYCTACNGTGEGQYDGSRCYSCGGKGFHVDKDRYEDF